MQVYWISCSILNLFQKIAQAFHMNLTHTFLPGPDCFEFP